MYVNTVFCADCLYYSGLIVCVCCVRVWSRWKHKRYTIYSNKVWNRWKRGSSSSGKLARASKYCLMRLFCLIFVGFVVLKRAEVWVLHIRHKLLIKTQKFYNSPPFLYDFWFIKVIQPHFSFIRKTHTHIHTHNCHKRVQFKSNNRAHTTRVLFINTVVKKHIHTQQIQQIHCLHISIYTLLQ